MGEHKVRIADVARDTGMHRNTVTLLYKEDAKRIDFDDLDRLCRYFKVSVGELLEFIESPKAPDA